MNLDEFKNIIIKQIKQGIVPTEDHFIKMIPSTQGALGWWRNLNFEFLGSLENYCEEIIFHGNGNCFKKESHIQERFLHPLDNLDLQAAFEMLALKFQAKWNYCSPFASFYATIAGKKFRISLIHYSCDPENYSRGFFRLISNSPRLIEDFATNDTALLIKQIILAKKNVLICGATGSGKTTFLSSVISEFDPLEHHLIIEDTMEINCHHSNTSRLLAGQDEKKSMKSYLTYGMRMSPDRIILGELRSNEVISFLMALNTGHRGSWSTIHANNSLDAIDRLCLLFNIFSEKQLDNKYVCQLACNALDYIIYLDKKRVAQITRIINYNNGKIIHENLN